MAELRLKPLKILHYAKVETVDDEAVNTADNPLVVVAEATDYEDKHMQIRVLPFDASNVDKETLPFAQKFQYYKKEIRNARYKDNTFQEVQKDAIVTDLIHNYFDPDDGFVDEFTQFMDGMNTKPVTGYENDLIGFFGDHYLNLPADQLDELKSGLGIA